MSTPNRVLCIRKGVRKETGNSHGNAKFVVWGNRIGGEDGGEGRLHKSDMTCEGVYRVVDDQ